MEDTKKQTVKTYFKIDLNPYTEEEAPIMKEDELEDSFSKFDLVTDKEKTLKDLEIVNKFVNETKEFLDNNFEKKNFNTWQDDKFLIKYFKLNMFVIVEHSDDYLFKDNLFIVDNIDYNLITAKLKR